jgi:prephenate dehydrogenase
VTRVEMFLTRIRNAVLELDTLVIGEDKEERLEALASARRAHERLGAELVDMTDREHRRLL